MLVNLNNRLKNVKEKEDILSDSQLDYIFEKLYPDFEKEFNAIIEKYPWEVKSGPKTHMEEMQEEILLSVRSIECAIMDMKTAVNRRDVEKALNDIINQKLRY